MKPELRTYSILLVLLAAAYGAFSWWYDGGGAPLTPAEAEHYVQVIRQNLTKEVAGRDMSEEALSRIRRFAEADDGKPLYLVNLVRLNEKPVYPDGRDPGGDVLAVKRRYERAVAPILLSQGGHPVVMVANAHGAVVNDGNDQADWDQFYVTRWRSRRDFLDMLSSPAYAAAAIHKFAADESTLLVPVDAVPIIDLRSWVVTTLLGVALLGALVIWRPWRRSAAASGSKK